MQTPAIEMKGITKIYPNGVVANKDVDFSVDYGEIHAVMGENGAGKSTLMKMLFGLEKIDKGEVLFEGKPIRINSPAEAIKLKIGMVHQEFMLVPSLTVSENMMLREEPKKVFSSTGQRQWKKPGGSPRCTSFPLTRIHGWRTCLLE